MEKNRKTCLSCENEVPNKVVLCPKCGNREFTAASPDVPPPLEPDHPRTDDGSGGRDIIDFDHPSGEIEKPEGKAEPIHFSKYFKHPLFLVIIVIALLVIVFRPGR